jgi:hypothetical protein
MISVGRATLTWAVQHHNICLALGSGLSSWPSPPIDMPVTDTALVTPVCMVRPTKKNFVTLADGATGAIQMANGTTWNISSTKTQYLHCEYTLQFNEGVADQYRELGIYLDPTFSGAVTAGQNYIPWSAVTNPGELLALERFNMMDGAGVRETFGRIMAF